MKKIFFVLLSAFILSWLNAKDVLVYAAANTTYAFSELVQKFNQTNPDVNIKLTLGASGGLTTQIKNGAKADLFLAANMDFAQNLYDSGFALTKPVVYAKGRLAIFSLNRIDLLKGLDSLKDAKSISIANPKTAPYGEASIEALKNAGLFQALKDRIIYAQKISETLSQALSAADAGFIAASAVYSPKMQDYKEGVNFIFVDSSLYSAIKQGIVLLKNAKDNAAAKKFYDFILGDEAKAIFKKYGYEI